MAPAVGRSDRSRCYRCGNLGGDSQGSRRRRVRTHGRPGDFGIGVAGARRTRGRRCPTNSTPGKGRRDEPRAPRKQPQKQHSAAMRQPSHDKCRPKRVSPTTRLGMHGQARRGSATRTERRRHLVRLPQRTRHSRGVRPGPGRDPAACRSCSQAPQAPQAPVTEAISPDPLIRWRILPTRRLERSTNGGKTWEPVPFPQPIDLIAVRAPSATSAIVTTADGRQFRTEDSGKTWNPVQP